MKIPQKHFLIDGACLTPLCQHIQLCFVQHMHRLKHVGLIQKDLGQLPVFVAKLVHRPGLPSVWVVELEMYEQSCKLMQNVYICQKPVCAL